MKQFWTFVFVLYKLIKKQRDSNKVQVVVSDASQTQVSHLFPTFHLSSKHETTFKLSIV